ncbi:lamin tail domain-containing protein, partial [Chloroflexus sp.]
MRWLVAAIVIVAIIGAGWQPSQAQTLVVLINEVMSYPETGTEWVELYNPGSLPVDLSGWRIDDSVIGGAHTIIPAGTLLLPGNLLVVPLASAILNNGDPDQAQLSNTTGELIDQTPLAIVPRGQTLARQPDGSAVWQVGAPSPAWWNSGMPPAIPSLSPVATSTELTETVLSETAITGDPVVPTATAESAATATGAPTSSPTATAESAATATGTPTSSPTATASRTATASATATGT